MPPVLPNIKRAGASGKGVEMDKTVAFIVVLSVLLIFAGCTSKKADTKPETSEDTSQSSQILGDGVVNPLKETDAEGIMKTLGLEFGIPEGAKDLMYFTISDEIAEMRFTDSSENQYTARIKPAQEWEDISGMYHQWTETDEEGTIGSSQVTTMTCLREEGDEEKDAKVCLWYDKTPGLMYSLSAVGDDLSKLDLLSYAEQVYIPVQGDAEGDAQ